jgi:hypothetical protein
LNVMPASVRPVQLVLRHAHRPAVVHGLPPATLVAAAIAVDPARGHDDMVIAFLVTARWRS